MVTFLHRYGKQIVQIHHKQKSAMHNELEGLMKELKWIPYDEENQTCATKVCHMLKWTTSIKQELLNCEHY